MSNDKDEFFCRVCGFIDDAITPLWYQGTSPSYDICPSCGNQTGENDYNLERVRKYREEWLKTGPEWWSGGSYPPKDWDPIKQMENIPQEWR